MPHDPLFQQLSYDQLSALANEQQAAWDFLFPRPRGQTRFTLHAPDALQEKWTVWDREHKRTYSFGETPLEAATAARQRLHPSPDTPGTGSN
jgi:hypothetical protein